MELEIKTTKTSQITWKMKLFRQSSLESKHSFSSSLDVNEECCSIVNPLIIEPSYQNFRELILSLKINQILRQKCKVKDENEDDQLAVVNDVQTNLVNGVSLNWVEWNSKIMSTSDKLVSNEIHNIAPEVYRTGITDRGIIQEQVHHAGGYCSGINDHDEQDDEEQEITDVEEKPSILKTVLYLILTVSSLILCFLPRVYGDKIPNLFLPCPWLFYGFNFALMLAATASLLSIDSMSNIKKVTRCFSDLAILSTLIAIALFLVSSFLWARCLWEI